MRKRIFILLIIIIVGGAVMAAFFCRESKYKDLRVYTEKLLEIKWNDCIETAIGDVEIVYGEEVAHVKLEVKIGYEEEVLSIVENRFRQSLEQYIIPPWQGHEFIEEVKNGNIQYVSRMAMDGKRIKTRNIEIYVVYDENNRMYIYVMG